MGIDVNHRRGEDAAEPERSGHRRNPRGESARRFEEECRHGECGHAGKNRESKDLAASNPEKVKQLQAKYNAWNSELVDPAWGPVAKNPGAKKANNKKAAAKKKKNAA